MVRILELITGEYFKLTKICIDLCFLSIAVYVLWYLHDLRQELVGLSEIVKTLEVLRD